MGLINSPSMPLGFDTGLVPGFFAGSMLAALMAREWKVQGSHDGPSMGRYLLGASLMGFGGMLAGGCAVGAGVTGGAIFSLTAWVALAAMWAGALATHQLVDGNLTNPAVFLVGTPVQEISQQPRSTESITPNHGPGSNEINSPKVQQG
jgi:peptidoglycan/LPS O-acetylase OafA/YrhL